MNLKGNLPFQFQQKNRLQELIKKKKKLQKLYLKDYNFLTTQDLREAHYQILLRILLKEFLKSNVNTDTMRTNVKLVELNTKITSAFLNAKTLKVI